VTHAASGLQGGVLGVGQLDRRARSVFGDAGAAAGTRDRYPGRPNACSRPCGQAGAICAGVTPHLGDLPQRGRQIGIGRGVGEPRQVPPGVTVAEVASSS
jgi:hypothetical protein